MYKSAASAIELVAASWPTSHPVIKDELDRSPYISGYHTPYRVISTVIQEELKQSNDARLRALGESYGVKHGVDVIARYCCHALQSAAYSGVERSVAIDELSAETHRHDAPLALLSRYPNYISTEYEAVLGLARDQFCQFDARWSSHYRWQNGKLLPLNFLKNSLDASLNELAHWHTAQPAYEHVGREVNLSGKCPAEKASQLNRISQAIVDICNRDRLLATRTYDLRPTSCSPIYR